MFFKYTKWAMLWAMLIFILCAIPGSDLPHVSLLELLSFDKFVHATLFFVLVILMIYGFKHQTRYKLLSQHAKLVASVSAIAYGALLEIMQGTCFKERTADVYDFIANTTGCLLAMVLFERLSKSKYFNQLLN